MLLEDPDTLAHASHMPPSNTGRYSARRTSSPSASSSSFSWKKFSNFKGSCDPRPSAVNPKQSPYFKMSNYTCNVPFVICKAWKSLRPPSGWILPSKDSQDLGRKQKNLFYSVTVYYSSRTQVEISTKQRHLGRRLGQTRHEHPGSCCGGVMWTALHSPSNHGLPHTRNTANRRRSPELWCPLFPGSQSHRCI